MLTLQNIAFFTVLLSQQVFNADRPLEHHLLDLFIIFCITLVLAGCMGNCTFRRGITLSMCSFTGYQLSKITEEDVDDFMWLLEMMPFSRKTVVIVLAACAVLCIYAIYIFTEVLDYFRVPVKPRELLFWWVVGMWLLAWICPLAFMSLCIINFTGYLFWTVHETCDRIVRDNWGNDPRYW